jgi:putative flippase GtrA
MLETVTAVTPEAIAAAIGCAATLLIQYLFNRFNTRKKK